MRKIKLIFWVLLTTVLMTSCGSSYGNEFNLGDGGGVITVTSNGKNIVLSENAAADLTLLTEKALSDEHTGITEMNLVISMEEVNRFGKEGLSIAIEYRNTRRLPVSTFGHTDDPQKPNIVTYTRNINNIWILIDSEKQYIMTDSGGVFSLPQEYYDEIMRTDPSLELL